MKLRTIIASSVLSIGILFTGTTYAHAPKLHTKHLESSISITPCTYKYSFDCYRYTYKIPVPKCTLPSVEDDGQLAENGSLLCKETHKVPTKSQTNVWDGYTLWDSCYEYHSKYACDQLND